MHNIDFKEITETNVINVSTNEFPTDRLKRLIQNVSF